MLEWFSLMGLMASKQRAARLKLGKREQGQTRRAPSCVGASTKAIRAFHTLHAFLGRAFFPCTIEFGKALVREILAKRKNAVMSYVQNAFYYSYRIQ